MDEDDFLAAVEADNAAGVEGVQEEASQPTPEPQAEPEPAPIPEPVAQQPAPQPEPEARPEPQHVPLSAMLDERDKRKAMEAELARYRQQEQQQQPIEAPDMFADPDAYAAFQDQKVQQALYQTNLQWSQRIAAIQYGEETVNEASKWAFDKCNSDPYFNAKVASSADPIGYAVQEWKREQIASQVSPDDFAQFQAWKAAQAQLQASQPHTAATPVTSRATPPRSLASAPSAGGVMTEVEQNDQEMFDEVMSKRE